MAFILLAWESLFKSLITGDLRYIQEHLYHTKPFPLPNQSPTWLKTCSDTQNKLPAKVRVPPTITPSPCMVGSMRHLKTLPSWLVFRGSHFGFGKCSSSWVISLEQVHSTTLFLSDKLHIKYCTRGVFLECNVMGRIFRILGHRGFDGTHRCYGVGTWGWCTADNFEILCVE